MAGMVIDNQSKRFLTNFKVYFPDEQKDSRYLVEFDDDVQLFRDCRCYYRFYTHR